MKRSILLMMLLLSFACSDDKNTSYCNVENPVQDLEWLRTELEMDIYTRPSTFSDSFVYQALYRAQPVFYISTCCPVCNVAPPTVRTCSGDVVGSLGTDVDPGDLKDQQIIWRTNNGICP